MKLQVKSFMIWGPKSGPNAIGSTQVSLMGVWELGLLFQLAACTVRWSCSLRQVKGQQLDHLLSCVCLAAIVKKGCPPTHGQYAKYNQIATRD